ncbi:hypothetical protein TNCV_4802521 [Trichonephila clavipes]|nr:hypothetical protein TNCV_4802521 [Trichonephila clavipes]
MINAKKKERFLSLSLPDPGTIVLRQKDINLVTGKPFRIKTCCSSQMLINALREDTEYLLDLGVNGMGQSSRTLPVVLLGRVNRYPYPRRRTRERRKRSSKRRGLVVLGSGGENPEVLFHDADQASKTRIRENALRTGPRQAVERATSKRGYHTG